MVRLDQALVERGFCPSREKAKRAIMAGQVRINDRPGRKPSDSVQPADQLSVLAPEKYVSRGGYKLEHALEHFQVDVAGRVAVDLGAATGGFTDCLLQRGAARVYAVDVGQGQFAWKLRHDPRVVPWSGRMRAIWRRRSSRRRLPPRTWWRLIAPSFPCGRFCRRRCPCSGRAAK